MKNILIVVGIFVFLLVVFAYFRARFILSKISFGLDIKSISPLELGLRITNDSDFKVNLKNTRAVLRGKNNKLLAYSNKVKEIKILPYTVTEVPVEVKVKDIGFKDIKYKISTNIGIVPVSYSETLKLK